jgi:hypothetical protein
MPPLLPTRRDFLKSSIAAATAGACAAGTLARSARAVPVDEVNISFGLVTYMWGHDWDLPTLVKNCRRTNVLGVELRTTHAHGVEPTLGADQRAEVRARFADGGVQLVGLGSNENFDSPDPAKLKVAIQTAKAFIVLSHDVGGTGVKVKPNDFHKDVPREKTIEQIGKALNELGEYGEGFGQQVRLEVHGQCGELPSIKAIMDVADNENVAVCWNSNPQDLAGQGLEYNFGLVRGRLGATCHVHPLEGTEYPYGKLFDLLVASEYQGWVLLEAGGKLPDDRLEALSAQRKRFDELIAAAAEKKK